ncbi:uncharacterized protein METZ01_LOCUS12725 [marine metagenome]|uniref:Aminotransferase class V domain-containing protein n=1 Tax=marine metagenome TaxID=408172 RepID=A0A381NZ07_9ZZZZ|nr:aminotransferase class V-fold PLP-dependent enzyme [Acidobacteriota bacterium]|tara:strand:+ start:2813 stop:4144 length:1332 start_codon:yes stop_codon:yes gene_type:complete
MPTHDDQLLTSTVPDDPSRRQFIGAAVTAGLASACVSQETGSENAVEPNLEARTATIELQVEHDNIYTRLLGVKAHLPGHGNGTALGGSRMPVEVIEAMQEANDYFVMMDELTIAAGQRAAEVVKAEAALITSGASGGLLLGMAACLTGTDEEKMRALPNPTWAKRECIIQKAHRYPYDFALQAAGATLIEVEGRTQLMNAIGDNTALIFGLPRHVALSGTMAEEVLQPEDLIQVAKQVGVPVMIDGASRLPPAGNLTMFNELDADLVVVSGGKGLRGPQSTGILSGRADLIEAARLQAAPNDLIGRGMKVGKEEIIGLIVALNRYEQLDHDAVRATWREKAEYLTAELQGIESFTAELVDENSRAPYVEIDWDEDVIPMTHREVRDHLRRRPEQRVALSSLYGSRRIQTRCMRDGEEVLVARWLRQFFTEGYKTVAATSASL